MSEVSFIDVNNDFKNVRDLFFERSGKVEEP